jgi:YARHG domain
MSTSPAHSADKLGKLTLSYGSAKDESLLHALSSAPDFPFVEASGHSVDREGDDQAQPATTLVPSLSPPRQAGQSIAIYHPPVAAEGRPGTRDSEVKRGETTIILPHEILPNERQIHEPHGDKLPPRDLTPDWVIQPRGDVHQGTPRLRRRRGYSLKKLLVTSVIVAMIGGAAAVEIFILVEDDFPSLPRIASAAPSAPRPPLLSDELTEFRAIINLSEPDRITEALALQPTVPSQPLARSENQAAASGTDVTWPHPAHGSRDEKTVGQAAAMGQRPSIAMLDLTPLAPPELSPVGRPDPLATAAPDLAPTARPGPTAAPEPRANTTSEPPSITRRDPTPASPRITKPEPTPESPQIARLEATPEPPQIVRPEPTPESPAIARRQPMRGSPLNNQASPHIGKAIAADRGSFLFADSDVRYLTRAELHGLSADRLHIARNEIFARRGRYFKDDVLRAYFEQFPWYGPHAWDVPLGPVERANVDLIQSMEAPQAASRGITGPAAAQTKADDGAAFADLSRRYLTPEDLQGLSADELAIVRNEIFARKGRYFKDDALRAYFSQFPWYQPHAWDVPLSPIEQANVKLVQSFEQTASTPRQPSKAGRAAPM